MASIESTIFKTLSDGECDIHPGFLVDIVAGAEAVSIYSKAVERKTLAKLVIQNIGTGAFMYSINTPAAPSVGDQLGVFHGIVPGGAAVEDGRGGILVLSRSEEADCANFKNFYIYSTAGTRICVTKYFRTDLVY